MRKKIWMLVFAGTIFLSCSKDADSVTGSKLVRVKIDGVVESEYSYDSQGNMIQFSMLSGGSKASETVRTYNAAGQLVKEAFATDFGTGSRTLTDFSYSDFSYDTNGRLAETRVYNKIGNGPFRFASKTVPAYDAAGRTISVTLLDSNNVPYRKTDYRYNDRNNIIFEESFTYQNGVQVSTGHSEYEHDDKLNPLQNKWVLPFGANRNNITKITFTPPAGTAVINITNIIYKGYTAKGYPLVVNEYGVDRSYEYE